MPFYLLPCNLSGCCASSHPGSLVVSARKHLSDCDLGLSFWPSFFLSLLHHLGNRAQPLQEGCFCWCDGIADVVIVNGVLEQTDWKGWVWWCSTLSALWEGDREAPHWDQSCTAISGEELSLFPCAVWGCSWWCPLAILAGIILGGCSCFHSTDSSPFPSGLPSWAAEECLPWARGELWCFCTNFLPQPAYRQCCWGSREHLEAIPFYNFPMGSNAASEAISTLSHHWMQVFAFSASVSLFTFQGEWLEILGEIRQCQVTPWELEFTPGWT